MASINNGMCRCCASEGTFKDLKSKYHWMGEEEIYAEMLKECFDVELTEADDGNDGGICEVCITQLRNASNFKKQVLHTEEQFKKHLENRPLHNIVKVEVTAEDNDSDNDNDNNLSEEFSGAGEEYEVPIKTEDEADEPKPKKRAAKASTSRAKKAKADEGESSSRHGRTAKSRKLDSNMPWLVPRQYNEVTIKRVPPIRTKQLHSVKQELRTNYLQGTKTESQQFIEIKMNEKEPLKNETKHEEYIKQYNCFHNTLNLHKILQYSNANVFLTKHRTSLFGCAYCKKQFLKAHQLKEHAKTHKESSLPKVSEPYLIMKIDITGLACSLCTDSFEALEPFMKHLTDLHDIKLRNCINEIVPYKFDSQSFTCAICNVQFATLKTLQLHMSTHYRNYQCDECSQTYVHYANLRWHKRVHVPVEAECKICGKHFTKEMLLKIHMKRHETGSTKSYKCRICGDMFSDNTTRTNHMRFKHDVEAIVLKCTACDMTFNSQKRLTIHTKKHHLLQRNFPCKVCSKEYFSGTELRYHMRTHAC